MTMAWIRTMSLGALLVPLSCVITVDDDPNDGGFSGSGGSGGDAGSSGAAGTAGSSGTGGVAGTGGNGGSSSLPAPTCDPEPQDADDECVQCFKRNCCEAWLGCDDANCTNEWIAVAECVEADDFADSEVLGMCISTSSVAMDGFVQENTNALIRCATSPADDAGLETLCSSECFGTDIFFE